MRGFAVIPNFMKQALRGEELSVYGDGSQTRSFQYIDDLVNGIVKLMEVEYCGPVNLGNPEEFTMLDTAADRSNWKRRPPKGVFRGLAFAEAFRSITAHVVELTAAAGIILRSVQGGIQP